MKYYSLADKFISRTHLVQHFGHQVGVTVLHGQEIADYFVHDVRGWKEIAQEFGEDGGDSSGLHQRSLFQSISDE